MKNIIFWFSGTGNSRFVAEKLASKLPECHAVSLSVDEISFDLENIESVGFVFPVYCFGLPLIVKKFLENFDLSKIKYIYSVATCGGVVGFANQQVGKILKSRGLDLSAAWRIDMASNYTPMGEPPNRKKLADMDELATKKVEKIALSIRKKERIKPESSNLIACIFGKIPYLLFSRKIHNMDKKFSCDTDCVSCGTCAKVCPVNNIVMVDNKPVWQHKCEMCMACFHWCPLEGIEFGKFTKAKARYHHSAYKAEDFFKE